MVGVRLIVMGVCLSVRGIRGMTWKYDDYKCRRGPVETDKHVLFECTLYGEERRRWRGSVQDLEHGMDDYEIIKGYRVRSEKGYLRVMWNSK